jgi:hypothetical protein
MAHPYWIQEMALKAILADDMYMGNPERTTVMNLMVNVPEGFRSNCMVPLVLSDQGDGVMKPTLPSVARVEHMRNGNSPDPNSRHGKINVQLAVTGGVLRR